MSFFRPKISFSPLKFSLPLKHVPHLWPYVYLLYPKVPHDYILGMSTLVLSNFLLEVHNDLVTQPFCSIQDLILQSILITPSDPMSTL